MMSAMSYARASGIERDGVKREKKGEPLMTYVRAYDIYDILAVEGLQS